ncbi:MAG: hypothetical protein KF819_13010 [Labilithrix sp.]|nr:hypothetical protein [Labilithrix sp.]
MLIASLRIFALLALASTSIACAATPVTTPRSRVARDLGCTTEETAVEKIADLEGADPPAARWQVTGCGKTAVYICTTPVRDCWREGAAAPTAEAAPGR